MILAGDIGGTKTVLALYDRDLHGDLRSVRETVYVSAEHASLDAIVAQFLREPSPSPLIGACFGVAGPVADGVAKITNLPWTIDARALSAQLGGTAVELMNDLQATALGMRVLPASAFAVLQAGDAPREPHPTIAVIAPGTGLGESVLLADERGRYRALPSEAGHADFAPATNAELSLWRHLRPLHDHVSVERVLSGDGLGAIYNFARAETEAREPKWLTAAIHAGDRNAAIAEAALADRDEACVRALDIFVGALAAEASNLALRAMATGGVMIGGGIPPKILPALQRPEFLTRFSDKGRFAAWTRTLAVRVALEPRAALLGAADYVATNQKGSS